MVDELPEELVDKLRQLLATIMELGSDLDETSVLRRLAAGACTVTGAARARIEVLDEQGGVRAVLTERGTTHARAGGPAPHGPQIGVELAVEGKAAVRMTLFEPAGGRFDSYAVRRAEAVGLAAETALRNARMHAQSERRRISLEATTAVAHALSSAVPLEEVLSVVTGSIRRALSATGAGVLVPHPSGLHEVRALDVQRGYLPRSRTLFAELKPALDEILGSGEERVLVVDRDVILVTPVQRADAERHLLGVWWTGRAAPVGPEERALVEVFAEQAGVAMDRALAAQDRDRLLVVSERERIARDLHDVVIQRIFASGLQLRSLLREDDLGAVRRGLADGLGDLDLTIRDIRSTIFALHHGTGTRLRQDARALLGEYTPALGFTPVLYTHGELDDQVDPVVAEHLLATLRELLSNVARHAAAQTCRVEVGLAGGWLWLEVGDDGCGLDPTAPRSGLENVALRASLLGGTFGTEPRRPAGTLVRWRVPVGQPDA